MSSFYTDNTRSRPQGNPDPYFDFGYGQGSQASKDQRMDELNSFGELPIQPVPSVHRSSMDHLLNKVVYSADDQQQSDFESAHFRAANAKFHRMAGEPLEETETSRRRNSNSSSLLGDLIDDLPALHRYDSTDEHAEFFEHSEPARRVHSLPDVEMSSLIFHTRSMDAISREQHYMVRRAMQEPAPQPLTQGGYHFQQQQQLQQQGLMDPRNKYPATSGDYESYSPYPKKPMAASAFNMHSGGGGSVSAGIAATGTVPSYADPRMSFGGNNSRGMGAMVGNNNGNGSAQGSQYSTFVLRIPTMLNPNAPPTAAPPALGPSVYGGNSNHQQMQQNRGGITTANGGWLNLTASRGQLLIGSNQGRGVYSERSSNNLIGAGLYEGTGTVYVVQLKCQYRHYVLDPRAPQYLKTGDFVMVDADRGEDLGIIIEIISMKVYVERQRSMHISLEDEQNEVGRILREASSYERDQLTAKYQDELMVIDLCKNLALNVYQMQMVVVDAEYQFDRHKLTVYYDSSLRIDFRELVRDLFAAFKTRIWFKKANNRYFKAKHNALTALATGNFHENHGGQQQHPQQQLWYQQQQQQL